jgi:purine-nucleoside phosphorylase
MGGAPVIILQGRVHSYEGYTPREVTFPMRVLGALGIRAVVLTNAAGGIQEGYERGPTRGAVRSHQHDGLESAGGPE